GQLAGPQTQCLTREANVPPCEAHSEAQSASTYRTTLHHLIRIFHPVLRYPARPTAFCSRTRPASTEPLPLAFTHCGLGLLHWVPETRCVYLHTLKHWPGGDSSRFTAASDLFLRPFATMIGKADQKFSVRTFRFFRFRDFRFFIFNFANSPWPTL